MNSSDIRFKSRLGRFKTINTIHKKSKSKKRSKV